MDNSHQKDDEVREINDQSDSELDMKEGVKQEEQDQDQDLVYPIVIEVEQHFYDQIKTQCTFIKVKSTFEYLTGKTVWCKKCTLDLNEFYLLLQKERTFKILNSKELTTTLIQLISEGEEEIEDIQETKNTNEAEEPEGKKNESDIKDKKNIYDVSHSQGFHESNFSLASKMLPLVMAMYESTTTDVKDLTTYRVHCLKTALDESNKPLIHICLTQLNWLTPKSVLDQSINELVRHIMSKLCTFSNDMYVDLFKSLWEVIRSIEYPWELHDPLQHCINRCIVSDSMFILAFILSNESGFRYKVRSIHIIKSILVNKLETTLYLLPFLTTRPIPFTCQYLPYDVHDDEIESYSKYEERTSEYRKNYITLKSLNYLLDLKKQNIVTFKKDDIHEFILNTITFYKLDIFKRLVEEFPSDAENILILKSLSHEMAAIRDANAAMNKVIRDKIVIDHWISTQSSSDLIQLAKEAAKREGHKNIDILI
ncbi:MAG: hypothetical protein Sylvanvirus6_18 [Sylvanvirus sp.]|uniref:Uncharacterized protein n=1 Tax=Sylvanvirus sp. TaxID=2487774 RepID=A0A3G5AHK4_9VIRU|nr:MAG: hypothetical protein Sylvanvirus6_18 [Sylvanvirus sp.]